VQVRAAVVAQEWLVTDRTLRELLAVLVVLEAEAVVALQLLVAQVATASFTFSTKAEQ
jgi:hypothetical protein